MSMTASDAGRRGTPGRGRIGGAAWVAVPVIIILLWLVLYPNLFVLADSVLDGGRWTGEHYARFFGSRSEVRALWNSVWISLASVVLSALIGVPLAFLFARRDFPGRRVLGALAAMPVLLPPLVGTLSFLFLYGESGFLTRGVQSLLGMDEAPWRLTGAWAVLLVHAYTMYVYFYLFTAAGLARLDGGYAEAAAALGAGWWTTLRRVTLPMLAPALGGAALLVFMTSMASFSAPYVFGGGFRVLTTQLFNSKLNGEDGLVAVEAVVLALASLLFLWMLQRYESGREYTGAGKGLAPAPPAAGGRGGWLSLGATLLVAFLLLPHATVLLISFVPEGTWTTQVIPPSYSAENYTRLFSDSQRLVPILNSLQMATVATIANVIFAYAAAWLLSRKGTRGRGWISALVALPWALPGTVLAIALVFTFNVHQPLAGRFVLVGTWGILPLAYFIRNIPLVTRAALGSFKQLDPTYEEAAASLGASRWTTARRVVLPLVLPGLAAGALLAFVTALGEFVASILLYTNRTRPISVEMLSSLRGFDFGGASAYGVILIVLVGIVFAAGGGKGSA
ncbi:ABC transporter permease [Longimicrobium terrae]|uniref:Iron(III) transport system permease protein n=2 Tax=Longimicrobium terrae TaxID=1639882 RepID=A0A841H106_9BACT|nr:iron ABC transporter permease [Longimicrobium terrae]MBB6071672.1 iron(III) transport system permease protein [Longimicrobium terrae]